MVPQDNSNSSSNAALLVNTSSLNSHQLSSYLALNEEINTYKSNYQNAHTVLQLSAQLMREELYECSLVDDAVLDLWEQQQVMEGKSKLSPKIGQVMKYFEEDVNLPSSNCSTPTWQPDPTKIKSNAISSAIVHPSVKNLKSKYEPADKIQTEEQKKIAKSSGVKQMAQMFNNKVSKFMNAAGPKIKRYTQFENEFSPEPKKDAIKLPIERALPPKFPVTQKRAAPLPPPASPSIEKKKILPIENDFNQLSVKEKAILYQKIIESQNTNKPKEKDVKVSNNSQQIIKSLSENFEPPPDTTKEESTNKSAKNLTTKSEMTEAFLTPSSGSYNSWPKENTSKEAPLIEFEEAKEKEEPKADRYSIPLNARARSTIYETSNSPLFVKLYTPMRNRQTRSASSDSACDMNSCSTPFADSPLPYDPKKPPPKPKRLRMSDVEFRPSSLSAMKIMRNSNNLASRQSSIGDFSDRLTEAKLPANSNQSVNGQVSIFWITAGDMTISLPIYYNAPDRLRLLYDIFTQKSEGSCDWHFGIDDHEFTLKSSTGEKRISSITKKKDTSQYWFSTGDLAIPFTGKYVQPQRIRCIFKFLRDYLSMQSEASLRFGIDDMEFSTSTQNRLNLSMDSNYSMLLRLQSTNGYLPSSEKTIYEQAEADRLSLTPIDNVENQSASPTNKKIGQVFPFRFSFAPESLDQLFGKKETDESRQQTEEQEKNKHIEQLWARLHKQELRLKCIKNDIRKLTGLQETEHREIIQQCKTIPEYVKQLTRMVRILLKIQKAVGYDANNMDQLEACRVILNRYTDVGIPA